MGSRHETAPLRVCEPTPIQDTFVTGILPPERYGDYVRITHTVTRPDPEAGGEMVREIVGRFVMPAQAFEIALRQIVGAVLRCPQCGGNPKMGVMVSDGQHGPLSS